MVNPEKKIVLGPAPLGQLGWLETDHRNGNDLELFWKETTVSENKNKYDRE